MSKDYLKEALAPPTQQEAAAGTVENSAGGQSFQVDPWDRLRRFLVLGSEGGSYYAGQRELTIENVKTLRDLLDEDGLRFVAEIKQVSEEGLAPKNDPALLALALATASKNDQTRAQALFALPFVARTGTHLFTFLEFVDALRGWGRGLRKAVAAWYTDKDENALGYQLVKYRQRGGWTHRDALRLAHPKAKNAEQQQLLAFAAGKGTSLQKHVALFDVLQGSDPKQAAAVIRGAEGAVVREMLTGEQLADADVQRAMLEQGMPMTALIRNLGNLTRLGVLKPGSRETGLVLEQLSDEERIRKARVHPLAFLIAERTYASGRGFRGSNSWDPVGPIVDALDAGFYKAFKAVEPTGKRTMLALDVSASMTWDTIAGTNLTPRDASAALALVTAATEKSYSTYAFASGDGYSGYRNQLYRTDSGGVSDTSGITAISITPRQRLDDAIRTVSDLYAGGTDCSLPMRYAQANGLEVDAFVIYTDSETWAGPIHPDEALRQYRRASGIADAKLVVVGMVANDFTIANPSDPGMLDVVGFDTSTPAVMSEFIR